MSGYLEARDGCSRGGCDDPACAYSTIVLPRPHAIVVPRVSQAVEAYLCQVRVDERSNLLSLIVASQYPPISVATIFALAVPDNDCERSSKCVLIYVRRQFEYHHDLNAPSGSFLKLFEWTRHDPASSSTSCGDSDALNESCSEISGDSFDEGVHGHETNSASTRQDDDWNSLFQFLARPRFPKESKMFRLKMKLLRSCEMKLKEELSYKGP